MTCWVTLFSARTQTLVLGESSSPSEEVLQSQAKFTLQAHSFCTATWACVRVAVLDASESLDSLNWAFTENTGSLDTRYFCIHLRPMVCSLQRTGRAEGCWDHFQTEGKTGILSASFPLEGRKKPQDVKFMFLKVLSHGKQRWFGLNGMFRKMEKFKS